MITLNVGCSGTVNWIQAKTNLLRRFPSGARYLIGVSGGRDSVVLLDAIADLDYRKLIVCHFDHQLRGRSSRLPGPMRALSKNSPRNTMSILK